MSNRYAIKKTSQIDLFREVKRKIMTTTCDVLAMNASKLFRPVLMLERWGRRFVRRFAIIIKSRPREHYGVEIRLSF
jgi:hypothetical protein